MQLSVGAQVYPALARVAHLAICRHSGISCFGLFRPSVLLSSNSQLCRGVGVCPNCQLLHMSHEWHWVFHLPCAAAWLIGYCSSCCCLPVGWAVHLPIVWWVVPIMVEKFVLEAQVALAPFL